MRLTKEDRYGHLYTNRASCRNIWSLDGKKLEGEYFENQTLAIDGEAIDKLGQLEDILEGHSIKTLEELDGLLWYVKQIKNIEQELGIDLLTLFKALKQENLFIKTDFDIRETIKNGEGWGMKHLSFEDGELVIFAQIMYPNNITHKEWVTPLRLKLKDYGKTWALTKEELIKKDGEQ